MPRGTARNLKEVPLPGGETQVIPNGGAFQWDGEKMVHNPTLQLDAERFGFTPPHNSIQNLFINLFRSLRKPKKTS